MNEKWFQNRNHDNARKWVKNNPTSKKLTIKVWVDKEFTCARELYNVMKPCIK